MISLKQLFSRYYLGIKPRTNSFHQVHKEGCPFLPEKEKRIYLGVYAKGQDALGEARSYLNKSEGCRFCMREEQRDKKELIFDEIGYAVNFPVSSLIHPSHEDVMHCYAS